MSEDLLQYQWRMEAEAESRAREERKRRWLAQIHSQSALDLPTIKASLTGIRNLLHQLLTRDAALHWTEIESLAMDFLAKAISAGAFGGPDWLEWRTLLAASPHIENAASLLERHAPPAFRRGKMTGNMDAGAAAASTLMGVLDQFVRQQEARTVDQASTSRIAADTQPRHDTDRTEVSKRHKRKLRQPSPKAFAAYRLSLATGQRQKEIAVVVQRQIREPVSQPAVSRWLKQVRRWLEAGNILPDLPAQPLAAKASDPSLLELGPRTDGLTKRQHPKSHN